MSQTLPRPPVVAILGHVDHGKTTLLDYIRKSRVAAKEVGGITQKIGAYEIVTGIKGYPTDKITFIDTPGHEAFSKLRARGVEVADIAILVVDAKDSVMPQTIESISHIKSAKIPYVVAINKMDLPDARPEKIKNDLTKHGVFVEGKGGDVVFVPISAKTGNGVNDLLEAILILTNSQNLKYSPQNPIKAYVIETKKDKRGIAATVIIKDGKIEQGNTIYVDNVKMKVRNMANDLGKTIKQALPSTPFELLGFETIPEVGSVITHEPVEKKIEDTSKEVKKAFDVNAFLKEEKQEKKLRLIIKADSAGSLEAIKASLAEKNNIEIILAGVGDINKSDVFLAKTTKAIISGFSIHVDSEVVELAKQEKVIIKTYNLIYELLEELEEVSDLLKEKEQEEKYYKGEAKIMASFVIEGETVYGVKVTKGKINIGDQIEFYRNGQYLNITKLVSLKMRAKAITELKKDQEGGMGFSHKLDIRVGDVVKSIL